MDGRGLDLLRGDQCFLVVDAMSGECADCGGQMGKCFCVGFVRHPMTRAWTTPLEKSLREEILKLESRLAEQEHDFKRRIGQSVNYALEAAERLTGLVLQEHKAELAVRQEVREEILALRCDLD